MGRSHCREALSSSVLMEVASWVWSREEGGERNSSQWRARSSGGGGGGGVTATRIRVSD